MFYKCIDGELSIPDSNEIRYCDPKIGTEGRAVQSDNVENDPSKWIDFYQKNNEYFYPINWGKNDYIIMHSGIYNDRNDVFIIFKKVQSTTPYKLVAISTTQDCIWYSSPIDINRDNARDICAEVVNKCKRIVPFSSISDVIFDCNKLPNWNNPNQISGSIHAWNQHPDRGYTAKERKNMCIDACIKSISNYRYTYPYVYFDPDKGGLLRGFLLPLEDKKGKVVLVATVMKNQKGNYRINTLLTPPMALEQARRTSTIEVDWMSKLL